MQQGDVAVGVSDRYEAHGSTLDVCKAPIVDPEDGVREDLVVILNVHPELVGDREVNLAAGVKVDQETSCVVRL
jgi:hypothetical protein